MRAHGGRCTAADPQNLWLAGLSPFRKKLSLRIQELNISEIVVDTPFIRAFSARVKHFLQHVWLHRWNS